jgi:acyl carrier protein phosphodiesterase
MNFLAHLFLSCDDENILIGNFIADMIRNKDLKQVKPEILEGIILHRKIDAFTDQHVKFKDGVRRLRSTQRKYAPVVLDILYDYLLAHHWQVYSDQNIDHFIAEKYAVLEKRIHDVPLNLQQRIQLMIRDDFLHQYTSYEGLLRAMSWMDKRTRFPSDFEESIGELQAYFEEFSEEFNQVFSEAIIYVKSLC